MKKLTYEISRDGNLMFDVKKITVDKEITGNHDIIDVGKLMDFVLNLVEETLKHPFFRNKFKDDTDLLNKVKDSIINTLVNTGRCVCCNTITSRKNHNNGDYVCIDCSH